MGVRIVVRGVLALLVLAPWTAMAATADRFDIATFDAPPGWSRQAVTDGLLFESSPAATRAFCQIFLSRSRKQVAALLEELDRTWTALLERQPLVQEAPAPTQHDLPNGVTLVQRVGQVRGGSGTYITMLNLFHRDDRLVTVVVNIADPEAFERCDRAIGEFLAGLTLDASPAAPGPPISDAGRTNPVDPLLPKSDPQLAARFGNTVVGTWRYALTSVSVTLNAPSQVRNVVEIQFARDGTYRITVRMSIPGGGGFNDAESGSYRVEGHRILMRPTPVEGPEPYTLDWFFGDHPEYRGNWGLILRSSREWLGSFGGLDGSWRTFKPAE